MGLWSFLQQLQGDPALAAAVFLTLAVVFVNGWTDAPNAIATCIATRSMRPEPALLMAAVFNFSGAFVMTTFNSTVAQTVYHLADFGGDSRQALTALCAALFSVVLWAVAAWRFGIPTSEGHAMIAGLSGAAAALQGGLSGINLEEWIKVLYGLLFSAVPGFAAGYFTVRLVEFLFRGCDRRKTGAFFGAAQSLGGAAMAFMHGAQDGQKFMAVFLLGLALSQGKYGGEAFAVPIWLIALCSIVMALGTSLGGARIIKAVGMDMVRLSRHQGFAADLAAAVCLLFSSLYGIPVSTTHVKTTAIMGVGASRRRSAVNWGAASEMVWAWLLTFPGCGLIGFAAARLLTAVF